MLEPYSSFFPAVFGKTKSRCSTWVTTISKPDIAITIPCYLIPHKRSNKLTYTFWFTLFCTCIFAFYRKRALYTLHFSNAYSCNYMYNVHVHLFSECLTDFFYNSQCLCRKSYHSIIQPLQDYYNISLPIVKVKYNVQLCMNLPSYWRNLWRSILIHSMIFNFFIHFHQYLKIYR